MARLHAGRCCVTSSTLRRCNPMPSENSSRHITECLCTVAQPSRSCFAGSFSGSACGCGAAAQTDVVLPRTPPTRTHPGNLIESIAARSLLAFRSLDNHVPLRFAFAAPVLTHSLPCSLALCSAAEQALVGHLIDLTQSKNTQVSELARTMYFNLLQREFDATGSFQKVQYHTIDTVCASFASSSRAGLNSSIG